MKQPIKPGLRLLLISEGLALLAAAMFGPIQALFVERLGGSLLEASYAGAIFSLAAGITTLIAGHYADKHRQPKNIITLGYALMGVGFLLLTVVQTIWHLLLVQILIGIAYPFYTPAFNALYARHVNEKQAGFEWGLWDATDYFMAAFGALAGGVIAHFFGFGAIFVIMGLLCFGSAIYLNFSADKLLETKNQA